VIRSVLAGLVGQSRKELKQEIKEMKEILNYMYNLKVKAHSLVNPAIIRIDGDLNILRLKQSSETAYIARVNWYELGEKSNKFFLNLNKRFMKSKVIEKMERNAI
jgi:hypothetical protein